MNRSTRTRNRNLRNKVLVGAIVAALALGVAGTATAQSANYTLNASPSWSQVLSLDHYIQSVNNTQTLSANAAASLGGSNSIFDTFSGSGVGYPQTVSSNTLSALAVGNNATGTGTSGNPNDNAGNSIAMGLLDGNATNSGLGILSGQLNSGNKVTSSITNAVVSMDLTGYSAGAVTENSNTIRADTRMNDASSTISGNLPVSGFSGTTIGEVSTYYPQVPTVTLVNDGDLTVGNAQVNADTTGSSATVSNSGITITDTTGGGTQFSNSNNTIAGGYIGNQSANAVSALGADGAPSYNGSVVVSNVQANINAPAATTLGNDVISTGVGGTLTGSITQSNDALTASAQGNTSSNVIGFAPGIDLDGSGVVSTLMMGFASSFFPTANEADLVLLNDQVNQAGSSFASTLSGGSGITATAAALGSGGSVTLSGDHAIAGTGGNAAGNSVNADGSAFMDGVSVGSQQVNDSVTIGGTTTGVTIQSSMDGGASNLGDVSVGTSSIEARAQGNQASTDVSLAGTNFNTGAAQTKVTLFAIGNDIEAIAGYTNFDRIVVGNVQSNLGAGTIISASNTGSTLDAYYKGAISGGSSTVNANSVLASAGANTATTSAELSGDNGQFTAALANDQYNQNDVKGTTSNAYVGIDSTLGVTDSTLTGDGNVLGASAMGNDATNSLATDFTHATLGNGSDPWTTANSSLDLPSLTNNTAYGALVLASSQWSDGTALTASDTNSQINIGVGGNLSVTPTTLNGNAVNATAVANQVSNTLDPGVGNLTAASNKATQVATLSNLQYANSSAVGADIGLASDPAMVGAVIGGTVSNSPVTVSGNDVAAFVGGNVGSNGIAITGTNYAPGAVSGAPVANGYSSFASTNNATAAFVVQSAQASDGGSRSASVTNGSTGIEIVGTVTNSPLTASSNQVTADARDNYVVNGLSLAGFSTLTTTAALQSAQTSGSTAAPTDVSGTVSNTNIGAGSLGSNVSGSDVTLSSNDIAAKALGNTSFNTLSVDAGQLGGDSTDLPGYPTLRGSVRSLVPDDETLADYTLGNQQTHKGVTTATLSGNQIGGGSGGYFRGGSLTISGNAQTAVAQANSVSNTLALSGTSTTASAAMGTAQSVPYVIGVDSTVTATQTSDYTFAAYIGTALGAGTVTPVTVSDNTLLAAAGVNSATNALNVNATSAINGTGMAGSGASDDYPTFSNFRGAVADFAVFTRQHSNNSTVASISPGLVGLEVANGAIGNAGGVSGLSVNNNQLAAQASANSASTTISLTGASSIGATTALNNLQVANDRGTQVEATASDAKVGIYNDTGASVTHANLDVSGNSLSAGASGNSASNAITVQPVALNAGSGEATSATASSVNVYASNTALASNAVLNVQFNHEAINATVSNSSIGVNPGVGTASALLTSVATVNGNSAAASASGNSASNSIILASLSSGVASSALVSNQLNSAAISATVSNVQIGVTAGTNSSTPVTVSGNNISATAVGNSATNHIGISN